MKEKRRKMNNKTSVISVKNAKGYANTMTQILIQNQLEYTPKVSVIIPVFNMEKYLPECLDKILTQTLKEIEIICVDDGSLDSSVEVLKKYAKKDKRITVLKQQNLFSGRARNAGLAVAKGEFVSFMDSDDYYPSSKTLKHLYENAKKHKVKICGGFGVYLKKGKIESAPLYQFEKEGLMDYKDYQFDYGYWRFLFNRQFLKKNEIYFPNFIRMQDPPFFIMAMTRARTFYALTEPTYVYRISHKKVQWNPKKALDVVKASEVCLRLAEEAGCYALYYRLFLRVNDFAKIFKPFMQDKQMLQAVSDLIKGLNWEVICKYSLNCPLDSFYEAFTNMTNYAMRPEKEPVYRAQLLGVLPLKIKKETEEKKKVKLFGITLLKIKQNQNVKKYYLFGLLPIVKSVKRRKK